MMTLHRNLMITTTLIAVNLSSTGYEEPRSIIIDSKVFMFMDGFELGDNSVHKAHIFIGKIRDLLLGKKDATGKTVGLIPFKNQLKCLKDIVEIENNDTNSLDSPDLQKALQKSMNLFAIMSEENLRETKGAATKAMTTELIKTWSNQRNLPNTLLLEWSKVEEGQEQEHFRQIITNFIEFDHFLEDLKIFLKDFMNSCPKSLNNYKTVLMEARSREKYK